MRTAPTHALLAVACAALLASCGTSRVVRRDYDAPTSRSNTPPASRAAPQPLPSNGVHIVQRGETLYGISFRYGLRYQDVAAWNGIGEPYTIEIGQRLSLRPRASSASVASGTRPKPVAPPRTSTTTTASSSSRPAATSAAGSGTGTSPGALASSATPSSGTASATPPAAPRPAGTAVASTPRPPAANPSLPVPPPVAGPAPAWRWPTRGQIIGRYVAGDRTQQGINIAGNAGQPVLAAADGVVVYSGAGLVGYGELVIIKHSEEWLSAYAHNRKRLVAEGARVKAGDPIAEMGRTGAIRDMLHFEIRRNGKPVDPMDWLPRE